MDEFLLDWWVSSNTFIEPEGQTEANDRLIQGTFRFAAVFNQKEKLAIGVALLLCSATPKGLPDIWQQTDAGYVLGALLMSASRCPKATEDRQLRVGQSSIRRCTPVSASPTHIGLLSTCWGQKVPHYWACLKVYAGTASIGSMH